jgi:hypothetical protein
MVHPGFPKLLHFALSKAVPSKPYPALEAVATVCAVSQIQRRRRIRTGPAAD